MCDDVRWWWERGMGYVHMTAEQSCHDTYMMNEHDLCMLHDGPVMGRMHAGGEEALGGPPRKTVVVASLVVGCGNLW